MIAKKTYVDDIEKGTSGGGGGGGGGGVTEMVEVGSESRLNTAGQDNTQLLRNTEEYTTGMELHHQQEEETDLISLCCCIKDQQDKKAALVIFTCVLYFMSLGIIVVPLKLLINQRIGGDPNQPTSQSAFVDTTNIFLYALMTFICGRYTCGLSDFVGRKPMMTLSALAIILTRIIYIGSNHPAGFYIGALVGGCFDCYYYTGLSWICDLFPEAKRRNKQVGVYIGVVLGLSLTISAPLGAAIASKNLLLPFIISPVLSLLSIVSLWTIPVNDTIGVAFRFKSQPLTIRLLNFACISSYSSPSPSPCSIDDGEDALSAAAPPPPPLPAPSVGRVRGLPADWTQFFYTNFPVSWGAIALMQRATFKLDWLANFLMQTAPALFAMIMLQYCLAVFRWTPTVAALAVFSIGLCLGIFGPLLLSRYNPVPLALRSMCLFTTGLILMSVAGTGISEGVNSVIGALGIACIALGTSWIPALQSNITNQYEAYVHGAVSGLLSQEKDLAVLPAYLMSLGFTFSLRQRGQHSVGGDGGSAAVYYWPGSSMAMAALLALCAIALHVYIHGTDALTLTLRAPTNRSNNITTIDMTTIGNNDGTVKEGGGNEHATSARQYESVDDGSNDRGGRNIDEQ